jgi:acyl-CoA thioester hydrolase
MTQPSRAQPLPRSAFKFFRSLATRWLDNDVYGHVNNAVNAYLIEHQALDIHQGQTIGLVVETQCHYFSPLAFPQTVETGIRVARIGTSSVRYEVGVFGPQQTLSAAHGHFIHVYVDQSTRRPVSQLPATLKTALEPLLS